MSVSQPQSYWYAGMVCSVHVCLCVCMHCCSIHRRASSYQMYSASTTLLPRITTTQDDFRHYQISFGKANGSENHCYICTYTSSVTWRAGGRFAFFKAPRSLVLKISNFPRFAVRIRIWDTLPPQKRYKQHDCSVQLRVPRSASLRSGHWWCLLSCHPSSLQELCSKNVWQNSLAIHG